MTTGPKVSARPRRTAKGGPNVLFLDIETAPIIAYVWGLWENNVAINQIHTDWYILSWAAKWHGSRDIIQADQERARDMENDARILRRIWRLLDQADIIVTQNGKAFDAKKLNARFIEHGMGPPSPYRHIDTKLLAKKRFAFSSNKLEYLAQKLQLPHLKMTTRKYVGFDLWKACLAREPAAWAEMRKYNIQDVLVLEDLWERLAPWDQSVNFSLWTDREKHLCSCGSTATQARGFSHTTTGKFQRYQCRSCGAWTRGRKNLLDRKHPIHTGVAP